MNGIFHVLVNPPATIEAGLVKEVSVVLKKDPYETRLLLSGTTPKLIAHYTNNAEADSAVKLLKPLGLNAFVVNDTELHKPESSPFSAHTVTFGEKKVSFQDKGGRLLQLGTNDVFLILKAKLQTVQEKTPQQPNRKFNPTATILLGGFPVFSKTKEQPKAAAPEAKLLVMIYDRISTAPRVEFHEENFDFSALGGKMSLSSFANINAIVTELMATFPAAIFNDTLAKTAGAGVDSQKAVVDMNCRLIAIYHQSLSNIP